MENAYIKIRFEVPIYFKYITRTGDGSYLFLHVDGNRLSSVK